MTDEKHDKMAELVNKPEWQLSRQQLNDEIMQVALHNRLASGSQKPHKVLSRRTLTRARRRMKLINRATNNMQCEAREAAANCPYTFLDAAAVHYLNEQLYGAPVDDSADVSMEVEFKIEDGKLSNLCTQLTFPVKETKVDVDTPRRLRPESIFYYDESMARTFKVSLEVMKKFGTKHVTGPKMKTRGLRQGINFVFGCSGTGGMLPVLLGVHSKKQQRGKVTVLRLTEFDDLFIGGGSALLVVYNNDDRKQLPIFFKEWILEPALAKLKVNLKPGEYQLIFMDGGCPEHLAPMESSTYCEEVAAKLQVWIKIHRNATSKLALPDLIALFKMIKNPNAFLKKLSMAEYQTCLARMTAIVEPTLKKFFVNTKRLQYLETFAVLFYVTLPSMHRFNFQKKMMAMGQCPRDPVATILLCQTPISKHVLDSMLAALPMLAKELATFGRCSDSTKNRLIKDEHGATVGQTVVPDNAALRNSRHTRRLEPDTWHGSTDLLNSLLQHWPRKRRRRRWKERNMPILLQITRLATKLQLLPTPRRCVNSSQRMSSARRTMRSVTSVLS